MKTKLIYTNSKYASLVAVVKEIKMNLNSNREQYLIVPDKFSLNAEKFVMEYLGLSSTTLINVTSLDRIADNYCKNLNLTYLSKFGGVMLVQKILIENLENLQVFKKSYRYSDFSETLFNNIMLLKSCNVSPADLMEKAKNLNEFSKLKLEEIAFIYQEYEHSLSERFYDSANKLIILKNSLKSNQDFANIDFHYAMFDDFTPQALAVFKELSKFTHSQTFGLLKLDNKKFNFNVATQKINALFLNDSNIQFAQFSENFSNVKNIISQYFGERDNAVYKSNDEIKFWQANSVHEEIEFIAKNIKYLVALSNIRYKQITIGVANLEGLKDEIQCVFNKYDIPYFIDISKPLTELILYKFLFSIFDCITNNFRQNDLINLLYSPLIDAQYCDKQKFENYLIAHRIEGNAIFNLEFNDKNLNGIKNKICEILLFFKEKIEKKSKIYDFCQIILEFFSNFNIKEQLDIYCDCLEKLSDLTLSLQNRQSIESITNLLSELQNIFGLTEISFQHFLDLIKAGCNAYMVASVPNSIDQVFIGDSNLSIFNQNDYFFFINCIEKSFPITQSDCGLITDSEIFDLNELNIEPTIREINAKSIFNLYNNILLYQNSVNFSFALNSLQKEEQKPSSFLLDLKALFCDSKTSFDSIEDFLGNDKDIEYNAIINNIIPYSAEKNILSFLSNPSMDVSKLRLCDTLFFALNNADKKLLCTENNVLNNKHKIEPLSIDSISATKIENYYKCPYYYFMQHTLSLKKRPNGEFQSLEVGNFLHKIAEEFILSLIKSNKKFYKNDEIDEKIEKIIKLVENNKDYCLFFKNIDIDYLFIALHNEAIRMCRVLNEQVKNSDFIPTQTEFSFSLSLKDLGLNSSIIFSGKIDRIDEYGNYFRIIDYKTGVEEFNLYNLYYGQKIQLHLYAYTLMKKFNKKLCGIYYMPIKDSYGKSEDDNALDFYRLDGIMIDDAELAKAQDTSLSSDNLSSSFIPIKFRKGNLDEFNKQSSKVCRESDLLAQLNYSNLSFNQAINEIRSGNIEPSPFINGNKNPCTFCPYKVACGFDESRGNKYRQIYKQHDFQTIFNEVKDEFNRKSKDSNI